eukprot:4261285-Prymnesium_polylepis.1
MHINGATSKQLHRWLWSVRASLALASAMLPDPPCASRTPVAVSTPARDPPHCWTLPVSATGASIFSRKPRSSSPAALAPHSVPSSVAAAGRACCAGVRFDTAYAKPATRPVHPDSRWVLRREKGR